MTTRIHKLNSIGEMLSFISNTPTNAVFQNEELSSSRVNNSGWAGTRTWGEAVELLEKGWTEMATKLESTLKAKTKVNATKKSYRSEFNVVGGNASVPRYLQGIPTNMVKQIPVQVKQKVVNVVKDISYNSGVSPQQIIDESIKALQIVQAIEATGARVNLSVMDAGSAGDDISIFVIKIKSSNERLNLSKMAFPLVHPSMLRRFVFALIETSPIIKHRAYTCGYGSANVKSETIKAQLCPGSILLPKFIPDVKKTIAELGLK